MSGHHHHGGHRRGRGGLGFAPYGYIVAYELGCDPNDPTPCMGADWMPTFVTPTDAQNYIKETDASWQRLAADVSGSNLDTVIKESWKTDFNSWEQFRDDNIKNVGWLNTKAVMDQTDRWLLKANQWKDSLSKAGAKITGPGPLQAGQGNQTNKPSVTPYLIGGGIVLAAVTALTIARKASPL